MNVDRYAVFGCPIAHSLSPRIHHAFAAQTGQQLSYSAQEVPAEQFTDAVTVFFQQGGKGLNCTVPLKELAWRFATTKTPRAAVSGAVNTLARQADGTILGDNTDGVGLLTDLTVNHGLTLTGLRVLIVGAGGAVRGILEPLLQQRPAQLVIANRTLEKAQALVEAFAHLGPIAACGFAALEGQHFDLIINATSASLQQVLPPLPSKLFTAEAVAYDLAYAHEPTPFLRWCREQGARACWDGLGMLVEQAAEAFYLWRGVQPETAPVIAQLHAAWERH